MKIRGNYAFIHRTILIQFLLLVLYLVFNLKYYDSTRGEGFGFCCHTRQLCDNFPPPQFTLPVLHPSSPTSSPPPLFPHLQSSTPLPPPPVLHPSPPPVLHPSSPTSSSPPLFPHLQFSTPLPPPPVLHPSSPTSSSPPLSPHPHNFFVQ